MKNYPSKKWGKIWLIIAILMIILFMLYFIHKNTAKVFFVTNDVSKDYPSNYTLDDANKYISTYLKYIYNSPASGKIKTPSFAFKTQYLYNFLTNSTGDDGAIYIHTFFTLNGNQLGLAVAGVDEFGDHTYINDNNTGNDYALENDLVSPYHVNISDQIEPAANVKVQYNDSERILISDAQGMIKAYGDDMAINKRSSSLLFDAQDLLNYIDACAPKSDFSNVPYIQFFIGEDIDRLTLIMVAVDDKGNHIFFSKDGNAPYYLLEHCYPCPKCDDVYCNTSLEDPESFFSHIFSKRRGKVIGNKKRRQNKSTN